MNLHETTQVLRALKAFDPMTSVTEDTAKAWHAILHPYPARQVTEAAVKLAERRRASTGNRDTSALDVFDVKVEVARVRADYLSRVPVPAPNIDPTDAVGWAEELRALTASILDGRVSPSDAARYATGGIRLTPGAPWRPAGALEHRPFPRVESTTQEIPA